MSGDEQISWTRSANVDQRQGQIIIEGQSKTTDGFWEVNDFIVSLDAAVSDVELGKTLLEVLAASRIGVEPLVSTDIGFSPLAVSCSPRWRTRKFPTGGREISPRVVR